MGEVVSIWIKRARRGTMDRVESAELVAGRGLLGSADQGGKRQITIISEAAWDEAQEEVGVAVDPSARRANVMIRGVDLENSHGKTLKLGDCVVLISGEVRPCQRMEEAQPGLLAALRPRWRGGACGEIVEGGTIHAGDVASIVSAIDRFVPQWQFREHHQTSVHATPERIFDAIRSVRAEDILFFRTMVAIRRGFRGGKESILNPAANTPILDVATRTGFECLADDAPREVVIGSRVAADVFAAMNFLVVAGSGGDCLVSTETRVHAKTVRARRRFGLYWFLIRPGSGFIRRMWLRAIRHHAEQAPRR